MGKNDKNQVFFDIELYDSKMKFIGSEWVYCRSNGYCIRRLASYQFSGSSFKFGNCHVVITTTADGI